jgi:hypothetical protein
MNSSGRVVVTGTRDAGCGMRDKGGKNFHANARESAALPQMSANEEVG